MGKEIERKFLVKDDSFRLLAVSCEKIIQAYLQRDKECTIRIRRRGDAAFITVKGRNRGLERHEFEYQVPVSDFEEMLGLASGRIIEKVRYIVPFGNHIWEVDEFQGSLSPLVLAEVELQDASETIEIPPFVGEEVSTDPRYFNSNL